MEIKMNNETVTIILPLPSPYLSPNKPPGSRGSRMRKAVLAKAAREKAKEVTEEIGVESGPWKLATLQYTFFHAQKRRRDGPNFLGSMKSATDGIVDSGLLVDDDSEHLIVAPPIFIIDKSCPRVEALITRLK